MHVAEAGGCRGRRAAARAGELRRVGGEVSRERLDSAAHRPPTTLRVQQPLYRLVATLRVQQLLHRPVHRRAEPTSYCVSGPQLHLRFGPLLFGRSCVSLACRHLRPLALFGAAAAKGFLIHSCADAKQLPGGCLLSWSQQQCLHVRGSWQTKLRGGQGKLCCGVAASGRRYSC